jgi:hypothetical protein
MKLLKSKLLLGVLMVIAMFAVVTVTHAAITSTLKLGSKGAQVTELQKDLGVTPATGYFGTKTLAAVKAFQTAHSLKADGVFGAMSRQALAGGTMSMTYPAGCTTASGFSPTTGAPCNGGTVTTTLPAGCTTASGFSPTTGMSCSSSNGGTVSQSGPITAMLSTDNPPAGYVIGGQATADLAHFTLTGSGTVNSITLQRTGISDQNTLTNVYLYNGNTRLTDGYSFNNTGTLTMNNLGLVVSGSMEIAVKADVYSLAANTASTIGVTLTGLTAGTTASTVNIAGNMMYVGTGTPATVYLNPAQQTVTASNVNAGTSGYTVWSNNIQVNTRTVLLKGANFRMVGSAPVGALANINLYIDGISAGNAATVSAINGSNYAMFDFSANPISLSTGSHTLDVRADVVSGSSYTVQVSLQQAADLVLFDSQLGINLAASVSSSVAFSSSNAGTLTINAGSASVVVDPTFSAMTNITGGSTNAVVARYKIHGYGEDVKVSSLNVTPSFTSPVNATGTATTAFTPVVTITAAGAGYMKVPTVTFSGMTCSAGTPTQPVGTAVVSNGTVTGVTVTTPGSCTSSGSATGTIAVAFGTAAGTQDGLNNVTLYFNGSQIGSQMTWTGSGTVAFNLGSQLIIPAATDSLLEVRADLQDNNSVNYTSGSVVITLPINTSNGQGQTSHTTLNFPSSSVATSGLSIQNGLLAVSQNGSYSTPNSANPNTAGVKLGSFTLQNQSSSEAVRVTSLVVGIGGSTPLTNLSNLRTSETSGSGANPVQPSASNTFSVDFTLDPGATKSIDILGDTSTGSGNVITTLVVTAIGSTSHVSVSQNGTGTAVTGQTVNLTAGTITNPPTLLSASATTSQFIASANGAANATKATYNFASTGGVSTINELKFGITNSSATSVSVNGVSAPFVGGVAYLTGLNLVVPNGQGGLNQDVLVSYPSVGTNGLASGTTSQLSLTYVKYQSGGSSQTFSPTVNAPTMVLVGSKPTITVSATSAKLSASNVEAIDVTVTADGAGNITLNSLPITVSLNAATVSSSSTSNVLVYDSSNQNLPGANTAFGATSGGTSTFTFTTPYVIQGGNSQTFKIYVTVAGVTGTGVNGASMSTSLAATSGFSWTDTAGSAGSPQTGTTYIPSYPNTTTSVVYN